MDSTDLQRLVLDELAKQDLSLRRAAARSAPGPDTKPLVSFSTLGAIARGRYNVSDIEDSTIRGIALALDVPIKRVMEAAQIARQRPAEEFRLPSKAHRLSPKSRRAILAMVDALVAQEDAATANDDKDRRRA